MNTAFLLMAQYNARSIIPIDEVAKDYFSHLTPDKLLRKLSTGEINIPVVRVDPRSQKGAKGIYLADLANYIDARRQAAAKEVKQLVGA